VLCRAHNRLLAEQVFGREHVEQQIHLRQRKSSAEQVRDLDPELASEANTEMEPNAHPKAKTDAEPENAGLEADPDLRPSSS
jgi:hypothetical protein